MPAAIRAEAPTGRRRSRRRGRLLVVGAASAALGVQPIRRWCNRWGATDRELDRPMPGDELVKAPKLGYTRAITIHAPPERVWPWLAQIGQGRGGFYSYDALENLVGCDIHSVDRIMPEHQQLAAGDIVRSGQDQHICWVVMDVDAPHHLVLQGAGTPADVQVPDVVERVPARGYAASTWQWLLEPTAGGRHTRLVVRQRCTYSPGQWLLWHVVEPLNFVMERKMLHGIKSRAEGHVGRPSAGLPSADATSDRSGLGLERST